MHRADERKRAVCLLRGAAGRFLKTSYAVTSEQGVFYRMLRQRTPARGSSRQAGQAFTTWPALGHHFAIKRLACVARSDQRMQRCNINLAFCPGKPSGSIRIKSMKFGELKVMRLLTATDSGLRS